MIFIIIICIILLILFLINKNFKSLKTGSLCLVTGGVKCGKSSLSVYLALRKYKRVFRSTKILNFFRKIFKKEILEIPLIYSNVPLSVPYVPITQDILLRKKRCRYGSVVYVQEASLVADSQLIKNQNVNDNLLLFNKLIAHSGVSLLIYDTQNISDVHYSIKRSLSNYFYIHHLHKCFILPFLIAYVQEYRYSDDGSVIAITGQKDLEETLKKVIIPKSIWKKFDSYCYSVLTDNLPISDNVIKSNSLKAFNIISFRPEFNINKNNNSNLSNNVNNNSIQNFKSKEKIFNEKKDN